MRLRKVAAVNLTVLVALLVPATALHAAKKGRITLELPPPRIALSDFDTGRGTNFGDLLYTTWRFFPSEDLLNRWRDNGYYSSWEWVADDRFLHDPDVRNALVLHDTKGDFSEVRVVTELRNDSQLNQVPFNLGCILTLRPAPDSGPPPTPGSELARVGLELGTPAVFWRRVGTLHTTSKANVYAIIVRSPEGPQLSGLFLPSHYDTVIRSDDFYLVKNFETEGPDLLRTDIRIGSSYWLRFFEEAAAAGVEEAARAIAATDRTMNEAATAALARYAECPADAPLSQRCSAMAGLMRDLRNAAVPDDAVAQMTSGPRSVLDAAFVRAIDAARADGRDFEAETLTWLQGDAGSAETTDPAVRLDGHAWVLAWLEQMAGRNLTRLLQLHEERLKSSEPRPEVAAGFIVRERHELARICERDAKAAEERALHASAACRRLMQSALLADKDPGSYPSTYDFIWAADGAIYGFESPQDVAMKHARRSAMELIKRIYPFVGTYTATVDATPRHTMGDDTLLPDAPIFSRVRMGIDQGNADLRLRFAEEQHIPLLTVTLQRHEALEISMETSSEERKKDVTYTNEVANDAAVQSWLDEVNSLAAQISALDGSISSAVYDSGRVTDTETWESVTSWGENSHTTTTSTFESMRSAISRVKAMGRAEDLAKERERLHNEYERARARRPSDTQFQTRTTTERCLIEWQNWTLRYTNPVRIEGGAAPFEESISSTVTVRLPRCPESRALGIARTDNWTTEERLREDDELGRPSHSRIASAALNSYFEERVQEYMREIAQRDLTDVEKQTEIRWCVYLFSVSGGDFDVVTKRQEELIQMARSHW